MKKYFRLISTMTCTLLTSLIMVQVIHAEGVICPATVQYSCYDKLGNFKGTVSLSSVYSSDLKVCIPGTANNVDIQTACGEVNKLCSQLPMCNGQCLAGESSTHTVKSCRGVTGEDQSSKQGGGAATFPGSPQSFAN